MSKLFEISFCEQVSRINEMIEALKEAKRKFEEDRAAAQAEYEAKINEMKEQYEQVKKGQPLMTSCLNPPNALSGFYASV